MLYQFHNNKNMNKEKLIDQVKKAFENELYVGDNNIVYNNSPEHLECSELKKAFIGQNWQDVTHDTIFNNKDSLPFFSIDGLKYYTPSFIIDILNDYYEADTLPDNLISLLTLPQEIDTVIMAKDIKKFALDEQVPGFDFEQFLYNQLDTTNERVNKFIQWANLFNDEQKKLIYQFLQYIDDKFSNEYEFNPVKPKIAIERYWFQFM
ncbi:hypothetical protein BAS09_06380 [Elizabethkingia ursingii]|uniref:Uncharacterized protein n=2 Tax=Elizabethkingia ursingii TaxID=1756150 RepID=A0AAJ3NGW3_9FLAO|nr:hypothetical protein BBD34_16740 [Elizabethkingia ursingii]OPB81168.1 hypothetical protein BAY32_00380 [Elizabethkingia ursingii]OPC03321.1 hypothetical protein BAS09_06380 [Elizabethkingia ursingii]